MTLVFEGIKCIFVPDNAYGNLNWCPANSNFIDVESGMKFDKRKLCLTSIEYLRMNFNRSLERTVSFFCDVIQRNLNNMNDKASKYMNRTYRIHLVFCYQLQWWV